MKKIYRESTRTPRQYRRYLFIRNNIYYFRLALTEWQRKLLGRREIRVSLHTPYKKEADKYAQQLHEAIANFLAEKPEPYVDVQGHITEKINSILSGKPEKSVSVIHIRRQVANTLLELATQISNPQAMSYEESFVVPSEEPKKVGKTKRTTKKEKEEDKPVDSPYPQMPPYPPAYPPMMPYYGYMPYLPFPIKGRDMRYSELLEIYSKAKIADGCWRPRLISKHVNELKLFMEIAGNLKLPEITREVVREYRETLRKLPPRRNKIAKYRNKSIKELLAMNPTETLAVKTINVNMAAIGSLMNWAKREGYIPESPAQGLMLRDDELEISKRNPFTHKEIEMIFSGHRYKESRFVNPAYYWCPLISLYTGMRLEEICQLYCDDIYEWEGSGIYVIDINARPNKDGKKDKELKTKNAQRIIPIHETLIKLGLLDYWKDIVTSGEERLFPKLTKTTAIQKYSKGVGKCFCRMLEPLGIKDKTKTFHSLRHTFSQFYKERNEHNEMFRQLFGHTEKFLAGRLYGSQFTPVQCYSMISELDYPIDVELIRYDVKKKKKPDPLPKNRYRRASGKVVRIVL